MTEGHRLTERPLAVIELSLGVEEVNVNCVACPFKLGQQGSYVQGRLGTSLLYSSSMSSLMRFHPLTWHMVLSGPKTNLHLI